MRRSKSASGVLGSFRQAESPANPRRIGVSARWAKGYAEGCSKDPYGRMMKISGDRDSAFTYTDHFWHPQSGLNMALYRVYDPNLGRWISRDRIGEVGDTDLYAYVWNNPLRYVDYLGLIGLDPVSQTAKDTLDKYNPESLKNGLESCGMICKDCESNKVFATGPVPGTAITCKPHRAPCPKGSKTVGWWHTHGSMSNDYYIDENFSPGDKNFS